MSYQKFKADYLFTGKEMLSNDQVLVTDAGGRVEAIIPQTAAGEEIQVYKGILSPGLINAHCHLELSHLKDAIPSGTGLVDFLCSVIQKRNFENAQISDAIEKAAADMYAAGIVGLGDICNTTDTIAAKAKSKLYWRNFIEVLGFSDERAAASMEQYNKVLAAFKQLETSDNNMSATLTPHAPYSISPHLFRMINDATSEQLISIHNQESEAENELYMTGSGDFLQLFALFGLNHSPLPVTGKNSLQSYLPYFNQKQKLLLIHNTYTSEADLAFAHQYAQQANIELAWCLCINANIYIEKKAPPVPLLMNSPYPIVLGTDSYSSNWQLNIASEIGALQQHFPQLSLPVILQWATLNGAKLFGWDQTLGSFEKGKMPGVVLLETNDKGIVESSLRLNP